MRISISCSPSTEERDASAGSPTVQTMNVAVLRDTDRRRAAHVAEEPLRALVVEDNPGDQYLMQRLLLMMGMEVQLAGTADDAIQLALSERPDIVFLDVILPGMSGYAIAERIRELYPHHYIPVVFVTGLTDDDVVLRCFSAGGDEVVAKPVEPSILRARIEAALRSRRLHETVSAQRDQLLAYQIEMSHDVDVTKVILDNFRTDEALRSPNIRYLMRPVETLNGDFIMAASKPSRAQCFIVGDFTGHGLPAAIGVMLVHGVFCSMVAKGFDIETIAYEINRKMHTLLPTNRFLSAALFEIDAQTGIMSVWNAGLPALYVRGDERRISAQFPSSALPLGILPPQEFKAQARRIVMSPSDRIYAYSDGIVEANNADGEMFGQDRLRTVLEADAPDTIAHLAAELDEYAGAVPPHDDLSCLEVVYAPEVLLSLEVDRYAAPPVRNTAARWRLGLDIDHLTVRSVEPLSALVSIIDTLQGFGQRGSEIYLVVAELYGIAVDYGLLDLGAVRARGDLSDTFLERERRLATLERGNIHIEFEHQPQEDGGALEIRLRHDGNRFDYAALLREVDATTHSTVCGINLVRSLCESLEFADGGRTAVARYRWREPATR